MCLWLCGTDRVAAPVLNYTIPTNGPMVGFYHIGLVGDFLGANDIVSVTLAGTAVFSVTFVNASYVDVVASASGSNLTGNVVIHSTSFGIATLSNGFTYNPSTSQLLPICLVIIFIVCSAKGHRGRPYERTAHW